MNNEMNDKIDAVGDCRTRALEIEVLRQEVAEMFDEVFPPEDCEYDYLDVAMAFYYFGLESMLHEAILEQTYHTEYSYRSKADLFKHCLPCPWEAAGNAARIKVETK